MLTNEVLMVQGYQSNEVGQKVLVEKHIFMSFELKFKWYQLLYALCLLLFE